MRGTISAKMPLWLQILQGLMTPVIAGIAVYIAWQQWKANERKLVLDRYDRRLRVYQRVVEFLGLVLRDFKPEPHEVIKFRGDTAEADFLFGPDISAYLDEVVKQALSSWQVHTEYRDYTQTPPPGYDHKKVVDEMHERSVWFTQQHEIAKAKFKKYLDISK